jgi:hypothetical protein
MSSEAVPKRKLLNKQLKLSCYHLSQIILSTIALPFHYQFIAGAIAGISEILTMYPLDGMYGAGSPLAVMKRKG